MLKFVEYIIDDSYYLEKILLFGKKCPEFLDACKLKKRDIKVNLANDEKCFQKGGCHFDNSIY